MKRVFALLVALMLLCCACSPQSRETPTLLTPVKVKPDTATVQYENTFNLTSVLGCVLPYSEPLAFSVDGTVGSIAVLPGQSIQKGDILASLDTTQLQNQMDTLNARLKNMKEQAALQNRNNELAVQICTEKLKASGGQYEQKLLQLDLQEAQLKQKQAGEQQEFEQQQLIDSIEKIAAQIESASIRAPFDGTVSWLSANATVGATVSAKAVMFYLSDESRLSISTERISTSELAVCDRIYARIGDAEYELRARENDLSVDVQKSLNGVDLNSVFDFAEGSQSATLKSGNNAIVCCRSGYREHVLCVPTNALFRDAEGSYVYKMDGDEKTRTDVKTGTSTILRTEILSGLAEGDVVYVKD